MTPLCLCQTLPVAALAPMPPVQIDQSVLAAFGAQWHANGKKLSRTSPYSSNDLGSVIDKEVGQALAVMLGGIPVTSPVSTSLLPSVRDCVEVGPVRIVGGVRPQNFDVGYRPDGVRFAFDSKTLNDRKSVGKNYQNMINDLATEATTVHSRFPSAIVAFIVAIPSPCLPTSTAGYNAIAGTLTRISSRSGIEDAHHRAEALSLVVWNPDDGTISSVRPDPDSPLRIERFNEHVYNSYFERFQGLPPHAS